MLTVIVLFLFLPVTLYEYIAVLRHAERKVKIIHISILLISFCVLMLYSFNVSVPSPSPVIVSVLESIFKLKS